MFARYVFTDIPSAHILIVIRAFKLLLEELECAVKECVEELECLLKECVWTYTHFVSGCVEQKLQERMCSKLNMFSPKVHPVEGMWKSLQQCTKHERNMRSKTSTFLPSDVTKISYCLSHTGSRVCQKGTYST